jgi:7,8-dihydropterin-6-yl-methyl-4-(beta-D-ribofuranosyl)aminobenzene 5'-phosphate synthase
MDPSALVEVDSLEAIVIIDNELDIVSWVKQDTLDVGGTWPDVGVSQPATLESRGEVKKELHMEDVCCGAHGLSIMLVSLVSMPTNFADYRLQTATKGNVKHTLLFDTGPEEDAWERNANRLGVDLASIELIQLSHWHRDHSGGMLRAIKMIESAKFSQKTSPRPVIVDLHPDRPDYRGFVLKGEPISFPADPTWEEIESAGAAVNRSSEAHTVLDNMFLISGFIPGVTPYETGLVNGIRYYSDKGKWEKDAEIADERFLMVNVKGKGIIMFSGCSHRGVVNASKESINLLGGEVPLHAVVGGYHLAANDDNKVKDTVRDLKSLNPKIMLPGHCSGWRVKFEIEREMPGRLVPCSVGHRLLF